MKKEEVKPNYAEIARRWNCDYRTVKKYFEQDVVPIRKITKPSKLDMYKAIIEKKLVMDALQVRYITLSSKKGMMANTLY